MSSSSPSFDVEFVKPEFSQGIYSNPKSFKTWQEPPSFGKFSSWARVLRWIYHVKGRPQIPKEKELQRTLPVNQPKFPLCFVLGATWLGHATLFVRIDGMSLLTDPVWANHAAPFSWPCRRYRKSPCTIEELPEINAVIISHNHYDHLDLDAVKKLSNRFPDIHWFVPKGLAIILRNVFSGKSKVHELTWGENMSIELAGQNFTFWSIPAQHWSQRSAFDRNKSLWCGWLVEGPKHKFFYTGDTGFCEEEFEKVGKRFGHVDLSAIPIPIGCYEPSWFMQPQHIGPEEAVRIHQLCHSRKSIAVHWGTYEMGSCEHYMDPSKKLREEVEKQGLCANEFTTLEHGQSWHLVEEEERKKYSVDMN